MKANKTGKQGTLRVCEKTLARANYTDCQFWMPGIKEKQKSFVLLEMESGSLTKRHLWISQQSRNIKQHIQYNRHLRGGDEGHVCSDVDKSKKAALTLILLWSV